MRDSPMERLPSELRGEILSLLEFEELKALVLASPTFHEHYVSDRTFILRKGIRSLSQRLHVDLAAVQQASTVQFAERRNAHTIAEFLVSYHDRTESGMFSASADTLGESDVVEAVAFYFSVIKPCMHRYMESTWSNFVKTRQPAAEGTEPPPYQPLSRMEETRILRALYRYELMCNLFGRGRHNFPDPQGSTTLPNGSTRRDLCARNLSIPFTRLFEPWKAEEIDSVRAFVYEKWEQIFDLVPVYVQQDGSVLQVHLPGSEAAPGMLRKTMRSWNIERHISLRQADIGFRGLALLSHILQLKDSEELRRAVEAVAPSINAADRRQNMTRAFDEHTQRYTLDSHGYFDSLTPERWTKHDQLDPMPFLGDGEADGDGGRPPLVWTMTWDGIYSKFYGQFINEKVKRQGLIMWVRLPRRDSL